MLDLVLDEWRRHSALLGSGPPSAPIKLWFDGSRTIYVEEKWGPAIPYPSVDHDNGEKNHGYIRLKDKPALIGHVPEVVDWPEFQRFLEAINATASPIESMGCEKGYFAVEAGAAKVQLGSYVNVMFSDLALNREPELLLRLATELITPLEHCADWWASAEFGLERCPHIFGDQVSWCLILRIGNYGRTQEEARKFWSESLMLVGSAIERLPRDFPR